MLDNNVIRIDLKKSELEIILKAMVENIKNKNREMSMEEYNIIQNIKGVIGKIYRREMKCERYNISRTHETTKKNHRI